MTGGPRGASLVKGFKRDGSSFVFVFAATAGCEVERMASVLLMTVARAQQLPPRQW